MSLISTALLVPAAMMAATLPAPAESAVEGAKCSATITQDRQADYIKAVYRRRRVSRRSLRRIDRLRSCSRSREAAFNVRRLQRRELRLRRLRAEADRCTPYGDWAIPPYVVWRESRFRNVPNSSGSDASGYYQMLDSSFHAYGGPDLPGPYDAMHSPKSVQDCVAARMWAGGRGASHWAQTV